MKEIVTARTGWGSESVQLSTSCSATLAFTGVTLTFLKLIHTCGVAVVLRNSLSTSGNLQMGRPTQTATSFLARGERQHQNYLGMFPMNVNRKVSSPRVALRSQRFAIDLELACLASCAEESRLPRRRHSAEFNPESGSEVQSHGQGPFCVENPDEH